MLTNATRFVMAGLPAAPSIALSGLPIPSGVAPTSNHVGRHGET